MSRLVKTLWFCLGGLALSSAAAAQSGAGLEMDQNRIQQVMQSCLEGTGGDSTSDSSQARKCTQDYVNDCLEGAGYSGAGQRQCWGAIESYWSAQIETRTQRLEAGAPAAFKRYVRDTAGTAERWTKDRCAFYALLHGAWVGPAQARCLVETMIDRAVDLEVLEQNQGG